MKRALFSLPPRTALLLGAMFFVIHPAAAKNPEQDDARAALAQRLQGSWIVDAAPMLEALKRYTLKRSGEDALDEETKARLKRRVEKMAATLMLEFKDGGKAVSHQPGRTETVTYKLTTANELTGEFTMEVTPKEEDPDSVSGKIQGDKFSMLVESDKKELHLKRISGEQAKLRLKEIEDAGDEEKE